MVHEMALFNSFGHLLLEPNGNISLIVLEVLFYYSESGAFRKCIDDRYPKLRPPKDPVLNHVVEFAIKRFASIELPAVNIGYSKAVKNIFAASQAETYLRSVQGRFSTARVRRSC